MARLENKLKRVAILGALGLMTIPLAGCSQQTKNALFEGHVFQRVFKGKHFANTKTPSKKQAKSTLTISVVSQLGGINHLRFNNHGAFDVNNGQPDIQGPAGNAYANVHTDNLGRPAGGDAIIDQSTIRTDQQPDEKITWTPKGYRQKDNLRTYYKQAYTRGRLMSYSLVGGLSTFNNSTNNQQNVFTQTSWANKANTADSTGMAYYEGLIIQAVQQGKPVRYQVNNVYQGKDPIPMGTHLQAQTGDDSMHFNVFIPNVQEGIQLDYGSGIVTVLN